MSARQVASNVPLSAGCGLCCRASLLETRAQQCTHVQPHVDARSYHSVRKYKDFFVLMLMLHDSSIFGQIVIVPGTEVSYSPGVI